MRGAFVSIPFAYAVFAFLFSLYIYPNYVAGDQIHYRLFYEAIQSLNFFDAFNKYRASLGTVEPIYFFLVRFFAALVDKDILFSALNGVLIYYIFKWLIAQRVSSVLWPFIFLNFYVLVLFFAAERLKLSFLFFLVAGHLSGKARLSFVVLSIMSHLQLVLLVFVSRLIALKGDLRRLLLGYLTKNLTLAIALGFGLLLLMTPFLEHLTNKILFYMQESGGVEEVVKPFLLFGLGMLYTKERFVLALACLVVSGACVLLGSSRLVIFAYAVFIYFALQYRRGLNFGVLATTIYFSYKGVLFLLSVSSCGEGFDCATWD